MEMHDSSFNNGGDKVKFLCSYGGKIQLRKTDNQLHYAGGDNKIVAVHRTITFSEIVSKLNYLWPKIDGSDFLLKYQLPGLGLDSLISLIDDCDVQNMIVEYDLLHMIPAAKPARIRVFVFDISAPIPPPSPPVESVPTNPDYLFGFDKEYTPSEGPLPDLLDFSDMIPPENCGGVEDKKVISESHVDSKGIEDKKVISEIHVDSKGIDDVSVNCAPTAATTTATKENCGSSSDQCGGIEGETVISESHVDSSRRIDDVSVNWAPPVAVATTTVTTEMVYRVPVVVNGGMYGPSYAYGVVPAIVTGNLEQPVYRFVPVMQLDQRMMGYQRNY